VIQTYWFTTIKIHLKFNRRQFCPDITEKSLNFYQKILNKGGKDKKRYIARKTMVVMAPAFS
jgi:hypothetical protein